MPLNSHILVKRLPGAIAIVRSKNEVLCLLVKKDINENSLSEMTAYYAGWHDEPEAWYDDLVPEEEE